MKLYTIQTLAILFVAVFALAKGEENFETESGTVRRQLSTTTSWSATSNNLQLGKTPTEISFSFTPGVAVTSSATVVITETNTVNLWATGGGAAVVCLTTQSGAALANQPTCVATQTHVLTCTPHASSQIAQNLATVIKCTTNIAANPTTFTVVTFTVNVGADDQLTTQAGWKAGVVSIYFIKSECREDGKTSGSLEDCATVDPEGTTHCKYCSGGDDKFVVRTGLQQEGTTCSASANTRCDSLYFSDTSVDVAFSTNGNTGRITCGAYLYEDSAPTPEARNIEYESFGTDPNDLRSKNSVEVSVEGAETDHVMNLNGLSPDVRYLIRCHGEAMANMAEDLVVWTDINLDVWDISLTPDVLTTLATPTELILTFRHGATLTGAASGTTITMVTDQDVFGSSSATSTTCTMHSQTLGAGGTNNQVTQFGAVTQGTNKKREILFTITAGGASAALSKVTIRCTSNLGANVAVTNPVVIDSLSVVSAASSNKHAAYTHRTVEKVYGYQTTAA